VLVDGSEGSNRPGCAEYFLALFFMADDGAAELWWVAALTPVGREKLWTVDVLALDWEVVNWAYIGAAAAAPT
jgi:hypothetical protein